MEKMLNVEDITHIHVLIVQWEMEPAGVMQIANGQITNVSQKLEVKGLLICSISIIAPKIMLSSCFSNPYSTLVALVTSAPQ